MYKKRFKNSILLLTICFSFFSHTTHSQTTQSIYYKTFVRHASGEFCTHLPPDVTFTAYLNNDPSKILIENAPQWTIGSDPNIPGNGLFGVELGNFTDPAVSIGDTVFIQFTCNATKQQVVVSDIVTGIPWYFFPKTSYLSPADLPAPPQNLVLSANEQNHRIITWQQQPGINYSIYRRTVKDTVIGGKSRKLYQLIAQHISKASFTDTTTLTNRKYGYILYATSTAGIISSHSEEVNEEPHIPPGHDLTISWIARLPRLSYVWGSSNPAVEGWPLVGQDILWRAVVKNWTSQDLTDVQYKWYLDDIEVATGSANILAGDTVGVNLPWNWTFDRHELKFVLDPDNFIAEEEERNNQLMIYTDAISAGFYVEQSVYNYFHQYQNKLNVHSNCWEDWAQRHVRRWNKMFADAIYPDTPEGVLDRIRIDKITVVADGALPLAGGSYPTNMPNLNDRTVDLQWGFPASLLAGGMYNNHTSVSDNNAFYFEGSLLHELGHARYLIDLYGFNVHDIGSGSTVAIKENDQLIVGTEYMPLTGDAVHYTPIRGLMNGQYTYIDQYSTMAFNLIKGHRAILGNYNSPGNIGAFMDDLPAENRLTIKNDTGNLLSDANVKVYRATGKACDWYGKYYDNTPDIQLISDENGQVLLGRCPFDSDGTIDHTYGKSNTVLIIRVEHQGAVGYTFLESTLFNMEYWRGNVEMGNYELKIKLISPSSIAFVNQQLPEKFVIGKCYPNPFNSATTIEYEISQNSLVDVRIFDLMGREVITLENKKQEPGKHHLKWDGTNVEGIAVAAGVYLVRFNIDGQLEKRKIVYLK